jgi:DNA-binding NarL/FixJ family response regulator
MRVILVGPADARARLRAHMNGSASVVGEFASLAAARAARLAADAVVLAPGDGRDEDAPRETLTPREMDVLDLLAEGQSNKAIARRLGISDQTVKFHVAAISGKLGAANRTDAVRLAIRAGLVAV